MVETRLTGEKKGSKRHLLVDGRGVPLSLVVTGANRHDVTQLELVLEEIVIARPVRALNNTCAQTKATTVSQHHRSFDPMIMCHM